MSFLAPLFLLGGLAVALPVVFHLVRRTSRVRTPFSSLMFLQPSLPRVTRRSRLEHWVLLVLRCLALALLALAFARPFLEDGAALRPLTTVPRQVVVVLDTSASMRRAGLWEAARARVEALTRAASAADRVAVLAFAQQVTPVVTFSEWNAAPPEARGSLVAERLAALAPGWGGTQLGVALAAAADTLLELDNERTAAGAAREIILVSDLQAGSRLDRLQAFEWPNGVRLQVETVKPARPGNAGLQAVAAGPAEVNGAAATSVRVRVINAADSLTERYTVGWTRAAGGAWVGTPVEAYVPPGQSRIIAVPVVAGEPALDRLELRGDADDFDNTAFVAPPDRQRLRVLYVGNDLAGDARQPLYFLSRALPADAAVTSEVIARRADGEIAPADWEAAAIIFLTDVPSPAVLAGLRAQMRAGKTVLAAPKTAEAAAALGGLWEPAVAWQVEEATLPRYALWAEIDFTHPWFAPFSDPRFGDFTRISVWKYRRIEPATVTGGRVVARFDSGDPAVIEVPLGAGRLVVLASGWNPTDSQLAVSSKFVPLIGSLLESSGALQPGARFYTVGDALPLDRGAGYASLRRPDNRLVPLAAGVERFTDTTQPGVYRAAGPRGEQRFVVNVDGAESRTEPLSLDELERLGVPITAATSGEKEAARVKPARLAAVETEGRQKLWRFCIGAVLMILIVESALAGWSARRPRNQEVMP